MNRRQSPEMLIWSRQNRSRRVKSEIPDFFKNLNLHQSDSKPIIANTEKPKHRFEEILCKHRDAILHLLRTVKTIEEPVLAKLKELTMYPDLLSDIIYKHLRGERTQNSTPNMHQEEISEYKRSNCTLQSQLTKAKQSNEELTNMLISVELQQKMSVNCN